MVSVQRFLAIFTRVDLVLPLVPVRLILPFNPSVPQLLVYVLLSLPDIAPLDSAVAVWQPAIATIALRLQILLDVRLRPHMTPFS